MESTLGTTVCLICFEMTENHRFVPSDVPEKMISCCTTYLHSTLTKETLKKDIQLSNDNQMPLCKSCFDSALELTQLSEQLTSIQKDISDLAVAFSMAVFYRRSQVYSLSQSMQNDCPNSSSTIEFYEVCLPTNLFPITNKDNNIHQKKSNHEEVVDSLHTNTDIPNVKLESSADQVDNLSANCQSLIVNDDAELQFNKENVDKHGAIEKIKNLESINEVKIVHVAELNSPKNCADDKGGMKITTTELLKSVRLPWIRLERIKTEGHKIDASVVNSNQTSDEHVQNIFDDTQFEDDCDSDPSYVPNNSKIEKQLKCFYCEKIFSESRQRTRHHKTHTSTGIKPFKCAYCENAFYSLPAMKCHEASHEEGEKPFECSLCNERFAQESTRTNHERQHRGEKPLKCSISSCVESFASKFALQNHERLHLGEEPYKCLYCERILSSIGDKYAHQDTHNKLPSLIFPISNLECGSQTPMDFKCSFCEMTFSQIEERNIHEKIHSKENETEDENVIVGI